MKTTIDTINNSFYYSEIYDQLLEKLTTNQSAKKSVLDVLRAITYERINTTIYLIELENEFYLQVATLLLYNSESEFVILYKFHEYTGNVTSFANKNDVKVLFSKNEKSLLR